jgi:hypothetical protein
VPVVGYHGFWPESGDVIVSHGFWPESGDVIVSQGFEANLAWMCWFEM